MVSRVESGVLGDDHAMFELGKSGQFLLVVELRLRPSSQDGTPDRQGFSWICLVRLQSGSGRYVVSNGLIFNGRCYLSDEETTVSSMAMVGADSNAGP